MYASMNVREDYHELAHCLRMRHLQFGHVLGPIKILDSSILLVWRMGRRINKTGLICIYNDWLCGHCHRQNKGVCHFRTSELPIFPNFLNFPNFQNFTILELQNFRTSEFPNCGTSEPRNLPKFQSFRISELPKLQTSDRAFC